MSDKDPSSSNAAGGDAPADDSVPAGMLIK